MSAKRAIVLILLVVFTLQVAFPHPVLAAQGDHVAACSSGVNMGSITTFLGTLAVSGLTVWGINEITSVLAGMEFGIPGIVTIKDIFEPLDQAADFVSEWWLKAVFFGLLGSLASVMTGWLIEAALDLNINLLNNNAIINAGYGTILGLANLGFVLAIIVIAFATMFRRSGWDAQSSLARLIIAALLVNFSLFFAGIIMGIGNGLMSGMLGTGCWGVGLANQFNIVNINNQIQSFLGSSTSSGIFSWSTILTIGKDLLTFNFGDIFTIGTSLIQTVLTNMFLSTLSIFFASALTIIGALTLFGIFLFLIARYVALIILLIFMPIAWIGLIFPKLNLGTTNLWGAWWHNFLKWVFMGPLIVFFLYLTDVIIKNLSITQVGGAFNAIAQLLVLVVFSLASLWVSNKLSIAGAQVMYGVASKAIDKGIAGAKSTAANIATAPLRSERGQKISQAMARGKLNLLPGAKGLGRDAIVAGARSRAAGGAALADMKNMTREEKNAYKDSFNPSSAERAAVTADLLKSGDLTDPEKELNVRIKDNFSRQGMSKVYGDLEKFSLATQKSISDIASLNFEAATKELTDNIYSKARGDDFKKLMKFSKVFKDNEAVQEIHVKALLMSSPEAVQGAFRSLSYEDQVKFVALKKRVGAGSMSPNVKNYLENGPGKNLFKSIEEEDPVEAAKEQGREEGREESKS